MDSYTYDAENRILTKAQSDALVPERTQNEVNNFDVFGRLTLSTFNGAYALYSYNAVGERIENNANFVRTNLICDKDGKSIIETNDSNSIIATNLFGTSIILRKDVANTATYFHLFNGHGDVTLLINAQGISKASYKYDEFGNLIIKTGTAETPYTYASYNYDKATKLYYLKARYYDSKTARFISSDPYWNINNMIYASQDVKDLPNVPAIMQSTNKYVYCVNNPMIYKDPRGTLNQADTNLYLAGIMPDEDYIKILDDKKQNANNFNDVYYHPEVYILPMPLPMPFPINFPIPFPALV